MRWFWMPMLLLLGACAARPAKPSDAPAAPPASVIRLSTPGDASVAAKALTARLRWLEWSGDARAISAEEVEVTLYDRSEAEARRHLLREAPVELWRIDRHAPPPGSRAPPDQGAQSDIAVPIGGADFFAVPIGGADFFHASAPGEEDALRDAAWTDGADEDAVRADLAAAPEAIRRRAWSTCDPRWTGGEQKPCAAWLLLPFEAAAVLSAPAAPPRIWSFGFRTYLELPLATGGVREARQFFDEHVGEFLVVSVLGHPVEVVQVEVPAAAPRWRFAVGRPGDSEPERQRTAQKLKDAFALPPLPGVGADLHAPLVTETAPAWQGRESGTPGATEPLPRIKDGCRRTPRVGCVNGASLTCRELQDVADALRERIAAVAPGTALFALHPVAQVVDQLVISTAMAAEAEAEGARIDPAEVDRALALRNLPPSNEARRAALREFLVKVLAERRMPLNGGLDEMVLGVRERAEVEIDQRAVEEALRPLSAPDDFGASSACQ